MPESAHSHLQETTFTETATAYLEALLAADRGRAHRVITEALQNGLAIRDLYLGVFQPVQHEVGRLWLLNQVSVAEEHFCTAATQTIMSELYPQIISATRNGRSMVAACIGAELHEIGVRMVADFFEMDGWDTYYIGAGVPVEQILAAIEQHKPDLVALSATMTHHVAKVQEIITRIRAAFPDATPPIMVGGLPFNMSPELWCRVGADIWAGDAGRAVEAARQMFITS